jgi:hypothetical protein
MTRREVSELFEQINCARLGDGYAPHKPILVLLLLELIARGHENDFSFREFDHDLRRLLTKYGSESAADARNEPFWRLSNDGVFQITPPFSLLVQAGRTPSAVNLSATNTTAKLQPDVFQALRESRSLIEAVADVIARKFLSASVRRAIVNEAAPTIAPALRNYWWVSQNRTYEAEVGGNFMWSPKTSQNGRRNPNYDFMTNLEPGDVVFSFSRLRKNAADRSRFSRAFAISSDQVSSRL